MYELYVSLRLFFRFFFSPSAAGADLLAVFLALALGSGLEAGALEATVEAGALDAVDAGWIKQSNNDAIIHVR